MARYGLYQKISTISYAPGVRDTTDLEAGNKVITATVEASGVGNADYNSALTLAIPTNTKLAIVQIAARLNIQGAVTGTPSLRCRVYVDAQDADHRLFDSTVGVTTDFLAVANLTSGTIFGLLKDGTAHTFYFFLWDPNYVAATHEYTVSVAELWEGVGNCSTSGGKVLTLTHKGIIGVHAYGGVIGSGSTGHGITAFDTGSPGRPLLAADGYNQIVPCAIVSNPIDWVYSTVATDLAYINFMELTLYSVS